MQELPEGGRQPQRGANLLFGINSVSENCIKNFKKWTERGVSLTPIYYSVKFPENCMKMEKIGRGRGEAQRVQNLSM